MVEFPQDRRLTCNRLFRHLVFYSQQGFSGRLDISAASGLTWSIYMDEGKLVWATGGLHPRRRWRRQMRLVAGKTPDFSRLDSNDAEPFWDYLQLQDLARHALSPDQVGEIVQGTLAEVLFDIVQAFELPLAKTLARHYRSLLPLSTSIGVGDGLQVIPVRAADLRGQPSIWIPSVRLLQKETQDAWAQWVHLGLLATSPDSAPTINDMEQLQKYVSTRAFHNLTALLNGDRTFRDIALKMKRSKDQFGAGSALAPYIHQGLVGFRAISDVASIKPVPNQETAETPAIVCIDTVHRNHGILESLAAKVGCSYEAMVDGIEALYEISRPEFPMPALILVSANLPTLSAPETCQILRRVDRLQGVPIVMYSDRPRDAERIPQALKAGATEYLSGEDFAPKQLLALFERYVGTCSADSAHRPVFQMQLTAPVEVTDLLPAGDPEALSKGMNAHLHAELHEDEPPEKGTVTSRSTLLLD